jgi:hypothetical protein
MTKTPNKPLALLKLKSGLSYWMLFALEFLASWIFMLLDPLLLDWLIRRFVLLVELLLLYSTWSCEKCYYYRKERIPLYLFLHGLTMIRDFQICNQTSSLDS